MQKSLKIKGARVHNLKNIDVEIPRDKLTVITGLSGSGKSSLAFDTIYAEGHRRFVESLSSYARMFLGQLDKPDVDSIEGLSPAISIDQKTTSKNPRSTVGTVTEIYDYIRLLYARTGIVHCPVCGKEIQKQSIDQIINKILSYPEGKRFMVLSPVVKGKKGRHEKLLSDMLKNGYVRARVDGGIYSLDSSLDLDKNVKHNIDIVIDRLVTKADEEEIRTRLTDSVESACNLSGGLVVISFPDAEDGMEKEITFSQNFACDEHEISFGELSPRMFSFNSPFGACPDCDGLGEKLIISEDKVFPDKSLSLKQGACKCNGYKTLSDGSWGDAKINAVLKEYGCDIKTPLNQMPDDAYKALLYGSDGRLRVDFGESSYSTGFSGIINDINRRYNQNRDNPDVREYYEGFMDVVPCAACNGKRLSKEALCVTVGNKNIAQVCDMPVSQTLDFFSSLVLSEMNEIIAKDILKEIKERLMFLKSVGLEYLTLSRRAGTLSGGENQRIRLATQIGSSLMGVMYILDEPSIGLHQRDNSKLIGTLKHLRDLGNTVIVVEHDEETMREADYIVDIGPRAGIHGGQVVACGKFEDIIKNKNSLTADYLSGRRKIKVPEKRRKGNGKFLEIIGANENNLKNIDVSIPLGCFTCVTGVSGSGKSSLINAILYNELASKLNKAFTVPGKHKKILGVENLDKVICIDQSPIGRTPRSNPATYTGVFGDIRGLYSRTTDSKIRGYGPDRFSFNLKGGRCEACQGDGTLKIEMHFLPDVYVTCDVCKGKRYNRETLDVKYKGKSIYDVLDMTVEEGLNFFENIPSIKRKLQTLCDVGLGYIKIGQSSTTLSGGEAQRIKLATELSKRSTGKTVYILDEPTTGLHSYDVEKLTEVLQRLTDAGNTVIVIEHNLDMIKCADWIVDMGPDGGDKGGMVVACGTPEDIAHCKNSYTGSFLKKYLD